MNELTTYRWSFEEDVHHYKAAGIDAIGVWRQKLSDYGEEKGIELLQEVGLQVSNLLWAGGFTGSDGRTYRDSIEDAAEAVRLAGALKSPCLVVYSGGRAGHTWNHARRLLLGALKELIPLAASESVCLAIEPMHPGCAADCTFLTSLDDTLDVMDALASAQVKLVFDTYHLCQNGDAMERISDLAGRIGIVHISDCKRPPEHEQDRCLPGQGVLALPEIVGRLTTAGYDGAYDVELIGQEIETADYENLLRESKQACEHLLAAA
jgi:sugar phosphate isomerase/epimerase